MVGNKMALVESLLKMDSRNIMENNDHGKYFRISESQSEKSQPRISWRATTTKISRQAKLMLKAFNLYFSLSSL